MSQEMNIKFYDLNGTVATESHLCVAREITIANEVRYFIKRFQFGPERGLPINPFSTDFSVKLLERTPYSGDYITKYIECTKEEFNNYINFLQSNNDLLYRRLITV